MNECQEFASGAKAVEIIDAELSRQVRHAKMVLGSGSLAVGRAETEVFENQATAVVRSDLGCLPPGACLFAKASKHGLVEAIGIGMGWIPRRVEPVVLFRGIGNGAGCANVIVRGPTPST